MIGVELREILAEKRTVLLGANHVFYVVLCDISSRGARSPIGLGPPDYRGFTITLRYTTLHRIPLDERSAQLKDL
jgi:hypothetical protein